MFKKLLFIFYILFTIYTPCIQAQASSFFEGKDNIVIVIDPGHGGENSGTVSNSAFDEKSINLITANALIEELSKYEGVTIYTTRSDDTDLTLKERAEFAKSVNADFLFSLHYNASENHTLFGAEVWIPLYAPYHAPAYQFAYVQLQRMEELGLFIRGIKTREGNDQKDYYGIIRESAALGIPAVIIEHCHVDAQQDKQFYANEEVLKELGRQDALAIATFFNLKNAPNSFPSHLNALSADSIIEDTYIDNTIPNICHIAVENADYENGLLTLNVTGDDYDTVLMYYDYSLDGGKTYSARIEWPGSDTLRGTDEYSFSLLIELPQNTTPRIIFRAYNKFELFKESNILTEFETFRPEQINDNERYEFLSVYEALDNEMVSANTNPNDSNTLYLFGAPFTFKRFLLLFGFSIFWILLLVGGFRMIWRLKHT